MPAARSIVLAAAAFLLASPVALANPVDVGDVSVDPSTIAMPRDSHVLVLVEDRVAYALVVADGAARRAGGATGHVLPIDVGGSVVEHVIGLVPADDVGQVVWDALAATGFVRVEMGDTDCRILVREDPEEPRNHSTDIDRCTPTVHTEPGLDDVCKQFEQQCCAAFGTRCADMLTAGLGRDEISNEHPVAFCIGVRFNGGIDVTTKTDLSAPCDGAGPKGA